jgi:hypothetical protein
VSDNRDLETLLAIARQAEAERTDSEAAQVAAIRILANAGGALPIDDLVSRYGVSKQTLATLCDEERHKDKRRKVRARLGEVDGVPVIWLTASGHQAAGKSRGFEVRPTSDSLGHALGPSRLAKWLENYTPTLSPYGIELSVTWGPSCQAFSRRTEALAWARLKTHVDQSGDVGVLTGGLIPDALIIERRPASEYGVQLFQSAWKQNPIDRDEVAETIICVEVQNATRQASDPLRSKVDAWSAAVETLRVSSKVLWIVEPASCKVLANLGVGDPARRPGQLMISSGAVGLGGSIFDTPGPRWWVLDVPRKD